MKIRNLKYDFIIYTCLLGALICVITSAISYSQDDANIDLIDNELKTVINTTEEEEPIEFIEEPEILRNIDKQSLIENYLSSLRDNILKNEQITYEIIKTWHSYEVENIKYLKKITDTYFAYKADLKISNIDALIPSSNIQKEDNYLIIKINVYININENGYNIKTIDIL